jgi:hypothetical protein
LRKKNQVIYLLDEIIVFGEKFITTVYRMIRRNMITESNIQTYKKMKNKNKITQNIKHLSVHSNKSRSAKCNTKMTKRSTKGSRLM